MSTAQRSPRAQRSVVNVLRRRTVPGRSARPATSIGTVDHVSPRDQLGKGSRSARVGDICVEYVVHGKTQFEGQDAWGQDPQELRLLIVRDGEVTLSHPRRTETLQTRQCALILGTGPVTYASAGSAKVVLADIPAEDLPFVHVPRFAPFAVARGADTTVPCAVGEFIVSLLSSDIGGRSPVLRDQAGTMLHALVLNAVMALLADQGHELEAAYRRTQVLRAIADHYADRELNSAKIAQTLGISARSLQRLFETQERTIAELINTYRAGRAIADLRDPGLRDLSMTAIAERSGFPSSTTLRRSVSRVCGLTPTELREQASAAGSCG